ncbi:MAG: MurR/RpiR family transcriptional regulator [Erysipelotrichaceae bacterium]|nr:MurR/RpiR family transcriptional regulator [Erysipelotrichaceae bacterium]MDD3809785.1 MurR/RpiR family transcriptional regulator [Erysipelotrichaceae bacterium]
MYLDELMNKNSNYLNDNDYHIWDYVGKHKKECETISINDLALKCNVSRTTILRFTKRLGLQGFSQFKAYLQLDNQGVKTKSDNLDTFYSCYKDYMGYLMEKDFAPLLERLNSSVEIYACSTGSIQSSVTSELKRTFVGLGKFIYQIKLFEEISVYEQVITSDDFIFMVSYSGENEKIIEFAKKLKTKGVYMVAITCSKNNQLNQICDEALIVEVPVATYANGIRHDGMVNSFILIDFLTIKYLDHIQKRGQ